MIPLVFVERFIGGALTTDYILGGFNSSAFDWDENHGLLITSLSATDVLEALSVETTIMDIYAIDLDGDEEVIDFESFPLFASDLEPIASICEDLVDAIENTNITSVTRTGDLEDPMKEEPAEEGEMMGMIMSGAFERSLIGCGYFFATVTALFL